MKGVTMGGAWRGVAIGLVLALVAGTPALGQEQEDTYRFEGSGWGHGVGMSQYGARGMANEGRSAEQILSYFYSGSTIRRATLGYTLWVGLVQNRVEVAFQADEEVELWLRHLDGQSPTEPVATLTGQFVFRVLPSGACRFFQVSSGTETSVGYEGQCWATVRRPPGGGALVEVAETGTTYGRGEFRMRPVGQAFHLMLDLGMEDYLRGIAEMPSSWPREALRAQAFAARTYAHRRAISLGREDTFSAQRKAECWCHLYATVRDQHYAGWSKEAEPTFGARWVEAVQSTAEHIVTTPGGSPIATFYSSSSGGITEDVVAGFGGIPDPHLVSVPDPWSRDPANNPNAGWLAEVGAGQIAPAVGLERLSTIRILSRNPSGTAREVEFVGTVGGTPTSVVKLGREVRLLLALKSAYFSVYLPPFRDDDGSIHESDISTLARSGITQGCSSDGTRYCPDSPVSRWQMAVFLVRALGLSTEGAPNAFSDDDGHEYEAYINALARDGVTNGCGEGQFCPAAPVTRSEMAAFLLRAIRHADHLPAYQTRFQDVPDGQWYTGYVEHLAEHGLTKGCSADGSRYCPLDAVTRAQMASFLVRSFELS
jgi:stage II sporulation protein D